MRFYLVFEQNITNIAKKTIDFFFKVWQPLFYLEAMCSSLFYCNLPGHFLFSTYVCWEADNCFSQKLEQENSTAFIV